MPGIEEHLQSARRFMEAEKSGYIDRKAKMFRKSGVLDGSDTADFSAAYEHVTRGGNGSAPVVNMERAKQSKLPKEIIESFKNNPIDYGDGMSGTGYRSVLDDLNIQPMPKEDYGFEDELLQEDYSRPSAPAYQQQPPTPQYQQPYQQPQPSYYPQQPAMPTIDYSMIKMFIDEAVKKNIMELKQGILNESRSNGQNLKYIKISGNKMNVLTDTGDLYEANLVFKKNVRKK